MMICFDGCHSVGVMEHAFHDDGVDMGVFCTYKYLNGGPGAAGGLFVHRKHLRRVPGLPGWFSSAKDRQFDMSGRASLVELIYLCFAVLLPRPRAPDLRR